MFPPRLRPYLFELLSTLQYPHTIAQRHPCSSSVAVIDRGTCQQPLLTPSRRSLWHHQDSNPMTKVKSCSVKALNIKKKFKEKCIFYHDINTISSYRPTLSQMLISCNRKQHRYPDLCYCIRNVKKGEQWN